MKTTETKNDVIIVRPVGNKRKNEKETKICNITRQETLDLWHSLKQEGGSYQDAVNILLSRLQSLEAKNADLKFGYNFAKFVLDGENAKKQIKPHFKSGKYNSWACYLYVVKVYRENDIQGDVTRVVIKDGKEQVEVFGQWLQAKEAKNEKIKAKKAAKEKLFKPEDFDKTTKETN